MISFAKLYLDIRQFINSTSQLLPSKYTRQVAALICKDAQQLRWVYRVVRQ